MSKQSEISSFFRLKVISYISGFLIFPTRTTLFVQLKYKSHFHAITCLKNIYYYFISNAENL